MAAVKLHNAQTEIRALYVACELATEDARRKAFAALRLDFFNTKISQDIFGILKKSVRSSGDLPPWDVVVSDAAFDQTRQDQLKTFKPVDATKEAFEAYRAALEMWFKRRVAFSVGEAVQKALEASATPDADDLLIELRQKLDVGLSSTGARYDVVDFAGDDGEDLLRAHLEGSSKDRFIPLGLETFDSRNKGIPLSGFGVLAGKSGDGKSAVALQCMINQAEMGYHVLLDSLEMRREEVGMRLFANVAEFTLGRLIAPEDMTKQEKDSIKKVYASWRKRIKTAKGKLIVRKPRFVATIEDLLNDALVYDPDVVWLDYLTLLAESDAGRKGASQAEALGSISQYGKTWASVHNKPVITLAQLNSEGDIKYARKILEDADVSLIIVRDKTRPESIGIHTRKCRAGAEFDFVLDSNYDTMRFGPSQLSPEDLGLGGGPPQVQGWTKKAQEASRQERQFQREKPPSRPARQSGF